MGLAVCRLEDSPESLVEKADAALYRSKQSGRNRLSIYIDERVRHALRTPIGETSICLPAIRLETTCLRISRPARVEFRLCPSLATDCRRPAPAARGVLACLRWGGIRPRRHRRRSDWQPRSADHPDGSVRRPGPVSSSWPTATTTTCVSRVDCQRQRVLELDDFLLKQVGVTASLEVVVRLGLTVEQQEARD